MCIRDRVRPEVGDQHVGPVPVGHDHVGVRARLALRDRAGAGQREEVGALTGRAFGVQRVHGDRAARVVRHDQVQAVRGDREVARIGPAGRTHTERDQRAVRSDRERGDRALVQLVDRVEDREGRVLGQERRGRRARGQAEPGQLPGPGITPEQRDAVTLAPLVIRVATDEDVLSVRAHPQIPSQPGGGTRQALLLDRYRSAGLLYRYRDTRSLNEEEVMELPTAYLRGLKDMNREMFSARPDAPVVPEPPRREPILRKSLSRAIYKVSVAVAPSGYRPEALIR